VGRLQEEVAALDSVTSASAQSILQKTEDLAVAVAEQSKTANTLELTRNRIMIEEQLKAQLQSALQDRKQAVAARNSAVRAARDAEAARWPDNFPLDQTSFGLGAGQRLLQTHLRSISELERNKVEQVYAQLVGAGFDLATIRKLFRPIGKDVDGNPTHLTARALGIEGEWISTLLNLGEETRRAAAIWVPAAVETYQKAVDTWDTQFATLDPFSFPAGTIARAASLAAHAQALGLSEDEVQFVAFDQKSHEDTVPAFGQFLQ
jgi:hypothetical protein